MHSNIIQHQKVLKLIKEFQDKTIYLKYFIEYEKPSYQRQLYEFWVKTIDKLTENIFKTSLIKLQEIQNLFSLFEYRPLCIEKVLAQMLKEGKIVMEGYQTKAINILLKEDDEDFQDLNRNNFNHLKILWNPLKKAFDKFLIKTKLSPEKKCPYIFHIKYYKENIVKFKKAVEQISSNSFNTFTLKQLMKVIKMPKREILFLINTFLEANLIQSVGQFNIDQINQEVYIYQSMWLLNNNNLEVAKNQTLFKLKQILNSQEREECYNIIELKEKKIISNVIEKKSPQEIKLHISEMLRLKKWVQNNECRMLILQKIQVLLKAADSDIQIQGIIDQVNNILKHQETDNFQLYDNINEIIDHLQQYNEGLQVQQKDESNEVEALYNQYIKEYSQMIIEDKEIGNSDKHSSIQVKRIEQNKHTEERILRLQQ